MKKFILSATAFILIWEVAQNWPTTVYVSGCPPAESFSIRMTKKDKKRLDYFFRDVCFLNTWAYTLLGSKPISINHYTKPLIAFCRASNFIAADFYRSPFLPSFHELCYILNPVQLKIKWGLKTLEKYIHLFPNSRFALLSGESTHKDSVWFALVNKSRLSDIINLHLDEFQGIFRELNMTPDELYANGNLKLFLDSLHDDRLIGIVLGYGRNNSAQYQKFREINAQEWPMVSMWADEDKQHEEKIYEKNLSFQPWDLSDLFYPYCACDPKSEETNQLKQTYRGEREKIVKYYEKKDVVEATLSLFNQL